MKKAIYVILSCLVAVFIFQAFTVHTAPDWKNLKILPQNISEDALDSVMHHFTASLNVKCNYCHVRNNETNKMDFANDARPEKLIARKMMLMTIDINKNHFNEMEEEMNKEQVQTPETDSVQYMLKYVTCYTCHKGSDHPENIPPPPPVKPNTPPGGSKTKK